MMKIEINAIGVMLLIYAQTVSAQPQWTWDTGKQNNNGSINIKSVTGGAVYAGTQNPTGAAAKLNQTAVTQPPTVVLATASLPIRAVGSTCATITTGSGAEQIADEGTAVTADRSALLTCQSGKWGKSQSTSGSVSLTSLESYKGKTTVVGNSDGTCGTNSTNNFCGGELRYQFKVDDAGSWLGNKIVIMVRAARNSDINLADWRPACDKIYHGQFDCPTTSYGTGLNFPGGRLRISPMGIDTMLGTFYWVD